MVKYSFILQCMLIVKEYDYDKYVKSRTYLLKKQYLSDIVQI